MVKEKKPKKEKAAPEPFWNELVEVYFNFCREKFHEPPSFDGSAPRDLKAIIKTLHDRAIKSNIEWTLPVAQFRFNNFLEFAYQDKWLKDNFLLSNINRQKDKIFFNIRAAINRQPADPFE
jgi:hypothetical protein